MNTTGKPENSPGLPQAAGLLNLLPSLLAAVAATGNEEPGPDVPEQPMASPLPESDGIRAPDRALLAALEGDPQSTPLMASLRDQAEQGLSELLGQALQWVPARATRAATADLHMGNVMELRDLMAASRRSMSGAENGADQQRTTARGLVVAGAANLVQPLWDPLDANTYADLGDPSGGGLLANLLLPPRP